MSADTGQGVLVVGESLVDLVRDPDGSIRAHAGGSAANVAVALARLGCPVQLATSYADDEYGRLLAEHLRAAGVGSASVPFALPATSTATATLAADGSASYTFDVDWRLNPVPIGVPPRVVHTCSLAAVLPPGADDVLALVDELRDVATITYDVNARPALTGSGPDVVRRVEAMVALSDLVKASDEDLDALYPELDHRAAARHLAGLGPKAVVVTRGGRGAVWLTHDVEFEAFAPQVTVVDTIGAGDTFGAGLIDGLLGEGLAGAEHRTALADLDEATITRLLTHAAAAAAVTVSRPGADPPYRHELRG
ncbi:carbohydrate kinase [Nocardioides sp.]|uniref:carbohydrate kinase family protein n=1 Tax=Nocardioides sp. TaxID=35761 RepID=UPI003569E35F